MRLREHQEKLLTIVRNMVALRSINRSEMAFHIIPGGGKSVLPVIAAAELIRSKLADRVCVVVPRLTLKRQAATAFHDEGWRRFLNHNLEVMESDNTPNPCKGAAGYVTTYQAIAANPDLHAQEMRRFRYILFLDEIHHVADGSRTHETLKPMWSAAKLRVGMTGSLDRNEGDRIAFLGYAAPGPGGRLEPEREIDYGVAKSIGEHAIIPITFQHNDAQVSYLDRNGQQVWLGTLSGCGDEDARDGIWAAINTQYADQLLTRAVEHWKRTRTVNRRSRLLVVCASISQAKKIKARLDGLGVRGEIATSDEDDADKVIKRFREERHPDALVTVQMAYEGLDVPDLTHLCCLTHIRSFPWLMQMFGRIWRFDREAGPWQSQHAFAFVPDDPLMQKAIDYIRAEQAIGVEMSEPTDDEDDEGEDGTDRTTLSEKGDIVPLSGSKTRERASGLDGDLDYQETAIIKELMEKHSIHGSPLDLARMFREWQSGVTPPPSPQPEKPVVTLDDRISGLRRAIQSGLNRIDKARGYEPGTMNRRCFVEAQSSRKRDELTEQDLARVWRWVQQQLQAAGLEGASRGTV